MRIRWPQGEASGQLAIQFNLLPMPAAAQCLPWSCLPWSFSELISPAPEPGAVRKRVL